VVLANGIPVEATRNPFWHQKPPYVKQTLEGRPDNFYGMGMGRMGLELQRLTNDFMNQMNDVGQYALNPVAIIKPNAIVGPTPSMKPGTVFNVLESDAVRFDRPPIEQLQGGGMLLDRIVAFMNDLMGAPPLLQGGGGGGAAKTATGSQILQSNVKSDLQDIIEDIELNVLIPLMEMTFQLGAQYENDERWMAVTGAAPMKFRREAFTEQYKFRWMASSQTANQQVRAQQALMFIQQLPAMAQMLAMQGKTIDPIPVLRRFYADALGGRDFDKIVVAAPMAPPGMGPPGAPGAPGALPRGVPGEEPIPGEDGGRARSAVEQAPGGSGSVAPGEAEDFMNVRAGADEMAGMMGAMGGGSGFNE
jgi:hypothetical protein